ncbi:MAG: MBL fold metallo-hydrolase [Prevotella sp.]|nr:MBL fold metallo-hydrolase [Prevotella sp.]
MLNIKRFVVNMLQENCYVVSDDTKECVIIDCGAQYQEERGAISHYIKENGLRPVHLLATHGHLDHNWGNIALYDEFDLKVEARSEDAFLIEYLGKQASELFGFQLNEEEAPVGHYFADGETICFGSHTFTILHTPGHTPGGCVYYCAAEKVAFTGDTLFRMSIGRTDFEGGSWQEMTESLHQLAQLPVDTTLYSGHGPMTTIAEELKYNPYLR